MTMEFDSGEPRTEFMPLVRDLHTARYDTEFAESLRAPLFHSRANMIELALSFLLYGQSATPSTKLEFTAVGIGQQQLFALQLPLRTHQALYAEVEDLQAGIDRFKSQLAALETHGESFPCLVMEHEPPLPMDLSQVRDDPRFPNSLGAHIVSDDLEVEFFATDDASNFMESRLRQFLMTRFGQGGGAVRAGSHGRPGVRFRVETLTTGLTVYYQTQFLGSAMVFSGTLTTPVEEAILPGNYYFGAGTSGSYQMDYKTVYDIPRLSVAKLNV